MLCLIFSFYLTAFARLVWGDFISTDYDGYNSGKLGHRPHQDFISSDEIAPTLQVNIWNEAEISTRGSHIFMRHDGNDTFPLASPLILDSRDLSAVYMNRSFENVFGTRVQENFGKKYLTFWAGDKGDGVGDGWGLAYDDTYRLAYRVTAQNISAHADLHEFAFTGHGTALVTGVDRITVDTKEWKAHGFRGPTRLNVLDAVFQEIDLETNEVLFNWRALDHIDPTDSYERVGIGWDIFHMNSVQKTAAGNYLVSIRHTHSIHLIDGKNGDIIWTLGGKRNVFKEIEPDLEPQAPLLEFSWQHHPRFLLGTNETEMTFFDNHGKSTSHGQCRRSCSRGLHIAIDDTLSPPTVKLLNEYTHPSRLQAQSQGSVQPLMTENNEIDSVFVGWGRCPSFTEHTPNGETVMDVQFSPWHSETVPDALDNYRAYKMDWTATPWWNPSITLRRRKFGNGLNVYVSWNGATEVHEWVVREKPGVLARSARTGFETMLTTRHTTGVVWAEALDKSGEIIGSTDKVDTASGDIATDWEEQGNTTTIRWQDEVGEQPDTNVGTILALVGGGLVGFAAVVYGWWSKYYRVYDRLESDDLDVEDDEYGGLVFVPVVERRFDVWKERECGGGADGCTIHGFWNGVSSNKDNITKELPWLPDDVQKKLFDNALSYPRVIYNGLRRVDKVCDIMDNGRFDPAQLTELRHVILENGPQHPRIYARVYEGMPEKDYYIFRHHTALPTNGLYIGQTIRWCKRATEHEAGLKSGENWHYRMGRKARSCTMVPLMLFPTYDEDVNRLGLSAVLEASELTMIALFSSWNPALLGASTHGSMAATASFFNAVRPAKTFNNIANTVATRTGWNPMSIVGLNWATPVIQDWVGENVWCIYYDPEQGVTNCRCRRRVEIKWRTNANGKRVVDSACLRLSPDCRIEIGVELAENAEFEHNDTVHVVVKFTDDNKDNKSMYIRYPRIGPNPALEILRTMFVHLEWMDKAGKWWAGVATRKQIWPTKNAPEGVILLACASGMGLASALQQITWTGAPSWLPANPLGRILIKRFEYDHIRQKITIQPGRPQTRPWPRDWTMQQNTARLQQLVADKNFNRTLVGRKPMKFIQPGRKHCDLCLSQGTATPCKRKGWDFKDKKPTCTICELMNRPCTFTDDVNVTDDLQTGQKYVDFGVATNHTNADADSGVFLKVEIDPPFDPSLELGDDAEIKK